MITGTGDVISGRPADTPNALVARGAADVPRLEECDPDVIIGDVIRT